MSLYQDFAKEYLNREVYETERGFIVYEIKDDVCYISDIYVMPLARRYGHATNLATHVEEVAKKAGCKKLLGSVIPSNPGATESMKAQFSFGFKIQSAINNFIWLEKEIT